MPVVTGVVSETQNNILNVAEELRGKGAGMDCGCMLLHYV